MYHFYSAFVLGSGVHGLSMTGDTSTKRLLLRAHSIKLGMCVVSAFRQCFKLISTAALACFPLLLHCVLVDSVC